MTRRIWFKAKSNGRGWYAATWQGWLILLTFLGLNSIAAILLVPRMLHDTNMIWLFLACFVVINSTLMWICFKTGEEVNWR